MLVKLTVFSLCIILLIVSGLWFFQSKLLFFPTRLEENFLFEFNVQFEEKFISYGDKEVIHGLLFKPDQPVGRILYFHGNGGALDSWGYAGAEIAKKLKCDVLILDYPGYGKSSGSLPKNEKALYESAEAGLKELISGSDSTLPIILYGRSLGSGVASHLATTNAVQALILETPYESIKEMAAVMVPFAPSFLVRYDLDNAKNIKELSVPILIIHGTADSVIPYSQAQRLNRENPKADFVTIEGGGHNDLSNFSQYWAVVESFVNRLSAKR